MPALAHVATRPEFTGPGDASTIQRALIVDPAKYGALFADMSSRWRLDGSVSTLHAGARGVDAIRRYGDPDAKAICIVREPAARARSAYHYLRGRGFESAETFAEGLAAEPERIAAGYHHLWHYRSMSHYGPQLAPFVDHFGDRLFVGVSEEIVADPEAFSRTLADFCELDDPNALDFSDSVNRGGEPHSRLLARVAHLVGRDPRMKAAALGLVGRGTVERFKSANRKPTDEDPTETEIRPEFVGDVCFVEEVLGRPIPSWRAKETRPVTSVGPSIDAPLMTRSDRLG